MTKERKIKQIRCRLPSLWQFRVWHSILKVFQVENLEFVCVSLFFTPESKRAQPKLESFRHFKSE